MDRMPCCREYLSIDHPIKRDDLLKAFQGQSHRTSRRHSNHFSAKEMSRMLKDFLRKDGCLYKLGIPGRGDIFVVNRIVNRITHSVGEIFFNNSLILGQSNKKWFPHLAIWNDRFSLKKIKIDSSLTLWIPLLHNCYSERWVKNLYGSSPYERVILHLRCRNWKPIQSMLFLILKVCIFPRYFWWTSAWKKTLTCRRSPAGMKSMRKDGL